MSDEDEQLTDGFVRHGAAGFPGELAAEYALHPFIDAWSEVQSAWGALGLDWENDPAQTIEQLQLLAVDAEPFSDRQYAALILHRHRLALEATGGRRDRLFAELGMLCAQWALSREHKHASLTQRAQTKNASDKGRTRHAPWRPQYDARNRLVAETVRRNPRLAGPPLLDAVNEVLEAEFIRRKAAGESLAAYSRHKSADKPPAEFVPLQKSSLSKIMKEKEGEPLRNRPRK